MTVACFSQRYHLDLYAHCSPRAIDNYYVIHRSATGTVSVNSKIEKAVDITCYRLKYLCTRTHARTDVQGSASCGVRVFTENVPPMPSTLSPVELFCVLLHLVGLSLMCNLGNCPYCVAIEELTDLLVVGRIHNCSYCYKLTWLIYLSHFSEGHVTLTSVEIKVKDKDRVCTHGLV